jgi:hypothetical protein
MELLDERERVWHSVAEPKLDRFTYDDIAYEEVVTHMTLYTMISSSFSMHVVMMHRFS